jgi:ABC-type lipoprotein export system ATPase subunit
MSVLEIRNLSKSYPGPHGRVHALRGVSLHVGAGEFLAVSGPSGSGKTTLLLSAGGILEPDSGQVLIGGSDVYRLSPAARTQLRATSVGFVFQQFHLLPYLSVIDNVLAAAVAHHQTKVHERAVELLAQLGLSHRARHLPSQLSSGERQRTGLARALLHRPPLLLADEPTGNLDEKNGQTVVEYLENYVDQGGALLLVTHDSRASARAQRILELGEIPTKPEKH